MNNHLLWTYQEMQTPTITVLADRMGVSKYNARKEKRLAERLYLVANNHLTKLGQLVASNLNNPVVQDYLSGQLTVETITIIAYNSKKGTSTRSISRFAKHLDIDIATLTKYLRIAESREWIGITQYADINNITYRNDWNTGGDVLEIIL